MSIPFLLGILGVTVFNMANYVLFECSYLPLRPAAEFQDI